MTALHTPDAPTRETWLQALAETVRPWFTEAGFDAPPPVRIGVGFSSKGARSKVIGECWYSPSVQDGVPEVFIHPSLVDPVDVGATLLHELVHASLGPGFKHGPRFREVAEALGLTGRMTATVPGDELRARLAEVAEPLGPYPHGGLIVGSGPGGSAGPKQTTRMRKAECQGCGYLLRTTQKWLDIATPRCPDDACDLGGLPMEVS